MIHLIRLRTCFLLSGIVFSAIAHLAMAAPTANESTSELVPSLLPATVTSGVASYGFGSVPVGSVSATAAVTFSVSSGTTVGSIQVLTGGVAGLDFASVAGGTCVASSYPAATTCTVNVTLTPKWPGLRAGAVVLADASGNALATVPVYGTGTGPELGYMSVNE